MPLAQNNPYAKVMHIGETVRIPTEPDCIRLHSCPVTQHLIHGYFVLLNTSMLNINIITPLFFFNNYQNYALIAV